jgi:hypothetical protein
MTCLPGSNRTEFPSSSPPTTRKRRWHHRGHPARLVDDVAIVDEIVVIDSDSTDDTARIASACQATVHAARNIQQQSGAFAGKGEALWKSLFVTTGDLLGVDRRRSHRVGPAFHLRPPRPAPGRLDSRSI